MPSLIKFEKIVKNYVNDEVITEVLKGVDVEINKGEFVAIMGPSGSGKSTLMHLMGFLDKPSSGTYLYKSKNVVNLDEDQLADIRNKEVGFVFQSFNLLERTSVFDNVKLPLTYSSKNFTDNDVIKAIKAVGLYHRKDNLSNQLSGGEKQRVAIARALVNKPEIIFADEPTGNLDSKTGKQIMEILQDLNDEGKTIILVTHEKYTAEHARRIVNIIDGIIVKDYLVSNRLIARNEKSLIK